MPADLAEKAGRYRGLLEAALADVQKVTPAGSHLDRVAEDYLNMARSYYRDGVHFAEENDLVNALVCFSYGHAWLDAGARLGVFATTNKHLFAAE